MFLLIWLFSSSDYPPRTLIIKATVGLLVIGSCLTYFLWRASHKGLPSHFVEYKTQLALMINQQTSLSS